MPSAFRPRCKFSAPLLCLAAFLFIWLLLADGYAMAAGPQAPAASASVDRSLIPAMGPDKKYGYIDAQSKRFALAPRYADASFFVDGIAIVRLAPPENGMALLEPGGKLLLRGDYEIRPAWPDGRLHPNYFDQGDQVYGRVFTVRQGYDLGVFHADRGWLLPLGEADNIRFKGPLSFYSNGKLVVDGKPFPLPRGFRAASLDEPAGLVLIEQLKSGDSPPLTGVLRLDGSTLIRPRYHLIQQAETSGVWVASRLSDSALKQMKKALHTGDFKLSAAKDYVSSDVFDASGRLLRSFKSHEYPEVDGAQYAYRSGRKLYTVQALDGTLLSEGPDKEARPEKSPKSQAGPSCIAQDIPGLGTRYGLAGPDGQVLIEPRFLNRFYFNRFGQALAYADGKHTVIDRAGQTVLPPEFESIFDESTRNEPLYIVQRNKLWGLMNGRGETLLPLEYGHVRREKDSAGLGHWFIFEDARRDKRGAYNHASRVTLPPLYHGLFFYPENIVAYSRTPEREFCTLLDVRGRKLAEYSRIKRSRSSPPVYIVEQNRQYGLIDGNGRVIIPPHYSNLHEADPVYFLARQADGLEFYVDRSGVEYRARE